MKKILTALLFLLVLIIVCIYVFIPATANIVKNAYLKNTSGATVRILADTNSWHKWWPGQLENDLSAPGLIQYNDLIFKQSHAYPNGVSVSILKGNDLIESNLTTVQVNKDSVLLIWKCSLPESNNPIKRLQNYYSAKKIRNSMTGIINNLDTFLRKDENIYGISFNITMSGDSTLIMTKRTTNSYPSAKYVYALITELKNYAAEQGAKETNFPMMDVKKIHDQQFEMMLAIPVNKELPGKGSIYFSRFVPW